MRDAQRSILKRVQDETLRRLRSHEDKSVQDYLNTLRTLQGEVRTNLHSYFSDVVQDNTWSLQQLRRSSRDRILWDELGRAVKRTEAELTDNMGDDLVDAGYEAYELGSWSLDQVTPQTIHVGFRPNLPETAMKALVSQPYKAGMFSDRLGLISEGLYNDIKQELLISMMNGESVNKASARVNSVFGLARKGSRSTAARAETIARTEILRASNLGLRLAYEENDDVLDGVEWYTTRDGSVCDECEDLDGTKVEDDDEGPPRHPNCRCVVLPRVKSLAEIFDLTKEEFDEDERPQIMAQRKKGKTVIGKFLSLKEWRRTRGASPEGRRSKVNERREAKGRRR